MFGFGVLLTIFFFSGHLKIPQLFAATGPWTQTDWSGGVSSGTVSGTVTTYESRNGLRATSGGIVIEREVSTANLRGTQLSTGATNLNVSSRTALQYNTAQSYDSERFSYDGAQPTRLTVTSTGDYYFSLTMPIVSSVTTANAINRLDAEVRVNGTKVNIGVGRSSTIRNTTGATGTERGTLTFTGLLENLNPNDYIEVFIVSGTNNTTNTLTSSFTFHARYVPDSSTVFHAKASQTITNTNYNTTAAALSWQEERKDSGFSHSDSLNQQNITIASAGRYIVSVNIPLSSAVNNTNIIGRVLLGGTEVTGGRFQQGYITTTNGATTASIQWTGVVVTASANQILTVTVAQEATAGTVTAGGEFATIVIQQLPANNVYFGNATVVNGANNFNPTTASVVNWATDTFNDTSVFTHSTSSSNQNVTFAKGGDYFVMYNAAFTGALANANPSAQVYIGGVAQPHAVTHSGFISNAGSHASASTNLGIPLTGVTASSVMDIRAFAEGTTGTAARDVNAILAIWRQSYKASGSLTSQIFDVGFGANWQNLTFSSSGTGTVTVKVRTSNSATMSGAPDFSTCNAVTSGTDLTSTNCATDNHRYVQYQITLAESNGNSPVFEDISIDFVPSDQVDPEVNATSVGVTGKTAGYWVNANTLPTITWTEGKDLASGAAGNNLLGYCVAIDMVNISDPAPDTDPETSSGILPANDVSDACPYVVQTPSLNLATLSGVTFTTDRKYYISLKAIDVSGNIYTTQNAGADFQNLFYFRYDATIPVNVAFVSSPGTVFSNINDMSFSWPSTSSVNGADDEGGSQLLGYQYQINSTTGDWKGTDDDAACGFSYIPASEASHLLSAAEDGSDIILGDNIVYFRTVDTACNISSVASYRTASLNYGGEAPTFAQACSNPDGVTITPKTATANNFTLSWPAATPADGTTITNYYYMVNVNPPSLLSTVTSNDLIYFDTKTERTVEDIVLPGVVKGNNTVYVVAVDSDNNYSSSNCIKATFALNSNLPDPPSDVRVLMHQLKQVSCGVHRLPGLCQRIKVQVQ